MKTVYIELIRPTNYDDNGFLVQWTKAYTPSNSLACVYSLFKQLDDRNSLGHDVNIIINTYDESHTDVPVKQIIKRQQQDNTFVLIGLVGVQTNQYPRALDLAQQFRNHDLPVIIGGFHVSGCMNMLPGIDPSLQKALDMGASLFVGEGENRVEEILRDLCDGALKPIYKAGVLSPALEGQPYPYLPVEMVEAYADSICTCDVGRGCPFKCNFCTIINVQGKKSRSRSADDIEKMVRFNIKQGINRLFITDDNFSRNRNWESILDRLIHLRKTENIKLNLTMQVDTVCHRIPGFIKKAAEAGCSSVFIGLETINADNLLVVDKPQNKIEQYRDLLNAWREQKVITYAGYIIGFPDDTPESVARDIKKIQAELPVDILEFFILTPLPGSELHRNMVQDGVPLEQDLNKYDLNHVTTPHHKMSPEELTRLYHDVWDMYYTPAHIRTMMQRAVASNIDPIRLQHTIHRFYSSISIDRVHVLQAGQHRIKRYAHHRWSHNPLYAIPFFFLHKIEIYVNNRKKKRLMAEIDAIRRQVITESQQLTH